MSRRRSMVSLLGVIFCVVFAIVATMAIDAERMETVQRRISDRPLETVYVGTGDTIWDWANKRRVRGVSTADLVTWIVEHNDLESSCLMPGQTLVVPTPMDTAEEEF